MKRLLLFSVLGVLFFSCKSKAPTVKTTSGVEVASGDGPPGSSAEDIAAGKVLFEERCGRCHRLYEPKEFTKEDWGPILKSMQPKAKLSDAEIGQVEAYIVSRL